jgi:hypothetical protein
VRFALNGEWAVGSLLVAETWPARRRGLVLSFDRSAWRIWRRARRHDRDLRGDRVGLAGSFRPARDDRIAGDLRPVAVSGITVLDPDAGPQAAHRRNWIIQPMAYNTKPTNYTGVG